MTTQTLAPADATLGFLSQEEEVSAHSLPVIGELPEWLSGTLVRVTPALLEPAAHWFDGLAMLNAFGIGDGRVSYGSRFLESREYRHYREHGKFGGRGFGTDPCRSLFQRMTALFDPGTTDNCNVNVTRLGERWIAMTETPIAMEFDPETLGTIGPVEWTPNRSHASAHPGYDFERRELVSYVVRFGARSFYELYAIPDGSSERRVIARVPVREPAYMHSLSVTSRYAILFDQPLVVNPLRLALGNRPFIENYEWKPERGSRFLVIDRENGELRASVEADAFFTFHQVNAFEADGHVVVDIVAFDDASVIDALYMEKLRAGQRPAGAGRLRRYRLPLDGGRAEMEQLSDESIELPRIAYRSRNGRPYRYVYAAAQHGTDYFDSVVKIDVGDRSVARWHEDGCYPGEPVFVAAPSAEAEDDGVVLSVVLDTRSERSFLLVLDAAGLEEIARAEAPQRIPFGFHGDFARREA